MKQLNADFLVLLAVSVVFIISAGFLLSAWPGASTMRWLWLTLSAIVLLVVPQPVLQAKLNQFVADHLATPWVWLALALLAAWGVFLFGHEQYGAVRHYGEALKLRSGLWAVLFHAVFLALLAQRTCIGRGALTVAVGGTGLILLALLAQPDYFSVLMLLAVMLLIAVRAQNGLRLGLFAALATGALLLAGALLNSPYRMKRLLAHWERVTQDPYGFGFESRMLSKATEQAGWWGFSGDLSATAMVRLPASLEWYSLNYLGLWLGNGVVLLALLLLFAFAYLLYRQSRQLGSDTLRLCMHAGVLLYLLNLLWSLAGAYAFIVPNAHYGIPFLSAGQMSLVATLLLVVAYVGRREPEGTSCD